MRLIVSVRLETRFTTCTVCADFPRTRDLRPVCGAYFRPEPSRRRNHLAYRMLYSVQPLGMAAIPTTEWTVCL